MSVRDVVIVGGGPAGSATALWLARAGYDVELLERRVFPRAKACGDCISPGANAVFRRMGVWHDVSAADGARLSGWSLAASSGAGFSSYFAADGAAPDSQYAFAIARATIDSILLNAARAAGAAIRTGARVTQLARAANGAVTGVEGEDGQKFRVAARLTVGADGLRSRVARLLGAHQRGARLRKVSFTAHVRGVPDIRDVGEMHIMEGTCLGIAPVQSGANPLCNVTVVMQTSHAPARAGAHEIMRTALRRFTNRDLSALIADDDVILASGPFDWPTRRITFDGAALVGDAAGYYDPFTGQGIFQALASAELLAEHSAQALRNGAVTRRELARYEARQRALVGGARRVQRIVEYVCTRPRAADLLFSAFARNPEAASRLIAVTGDLRPVRDLLSPVTLARLIAATALHSTV